LGESLERLQRISVKLAALVNLRGAGALEHVSAQDFGPEISDLAGLGEKPVAADVEAVAAVIKGARDATDILGIALEHNNRSSLLGES